MLYRSVIDQMHDWKTTRTKQALMVMGARQVGKTTAIREFASREYESLAEINFYENAAAVQTLSAARDANDLMLRISALTGTELLPGKTLLFLDEVQECKDMLTWAKFLSEKDGLHVVMSGSLLGLDAYAGARSFPVGYLRKLTMYPMNFEEFCLSRGVQHSVFDAMEQAVLARQEVPDYIHELLMRHFREYLLVGGMPDAVQAFADSAQIVPVRNIQRDIFDLYSDDIVKYVEDKTEARQIKMVYDAIPAQLNAPTKRFKYTRLGRDLRFASLETAFDWLVHAGIALEVTRVGETSFPLGLSEDRSSFKFFMNDIGILTSRLMGNVELEVINGRTNINYGSLFESVVAQELIARGLVPHYYSSKKRGEVDFIVEDQASGAVRLIEVKSGKDYQRHSALSGLIDAGEARDAVVLYDGNVEERKERVYIPVYAAHLAMRV